jgi:hypothetical protein
MRAHILATAILLSAVGAAVAQTAPASPNSGPETTGSRPVDKKGLGLTPPQARILYRGVESEREQPLREAGIGIGAKVPDAMMLTELPPDVKDQIGSLRDFKFARVNGHTVLLVDPTNRIVVDVIGKPQD